MASKAPLVQPAFNSASWDVPLNSNFGILTDALGTLTSVPVTTTDVTLTATQAQRFAVAITGTLTGHRNLLIPQNCVGSWVILNATSGGFNVSIYNDNGSGAPAGTGITPPTGYNYVIYSDGTNVNYATTNSVFRTGDTMTGALNLPSNGLNVGSGQLQVTGGNVTTSGQFTAGNNVTAYSDSRLKHDIQTIEDALDRVKKMRGVTFKFNSDGSAGAGVVAQEIEEVLPEVVYPDAAGYLHVAYGNICAVLINAIKELADRVEELEKK
jgi:hypothetical protein